MKQQNEAQILIGKEYVAAALEEIGRARQTINIIMYHWRLRPSLPDSPVSLLLRGLLEAQKRGVRVRCLVSSPKILEQLRFTRFELRQHHFDKLMHAKVLLCDERVAFVGSHNFSHSAFTSNLEVSLRVELTPVDNELCTYFKNLWGV